jgi:hypothetical protein
MAIEKVISSLENEFKEPLKSGEKRKIVFFTQRNFMRIIHH